jgi:tRNA pseudouridine13 synthase
MTFDTPELPPLLTADLPGIGGCIKQVPEDFEVEEIPAYEPAGEGSFLYLWVEKRDMGAEFFARQIARRLDIPVGEVGMAGLKDRHAVTRQMVSIPDVGADRLAQLEGEGIRVLRVSRHANKLRPGHLHGNRFRVLIRNVDVRAAAQLPALLDRLRGDGLPNFYGSQRFGHDAETIHLGLALLGRAEPPKSATGRPVNLRNPFLRKLALSAVQSALFNRYLERRLADGLLRQVLSGDVMAKLPFGGLFVAQDLGREQQRFDARQTVHTGPMFGRKMFTAAGVAAAREAELSKEAGLEPAIFCGFGKLMLGTRRPNLVYCADLVGGMEAEGVRLTFTLPSGSYATVLLREVMKNDVPDPDVQTEHGRGQRS